MREMRNAYNILVENLNNSEDLGVDGKIILQWILGEWSGKGWTGFVWLSIVTISGLL
jgi:hypothetical protein